MEKLFNYITYLTKYLNLLIEAEEAAELMKEEIKTETYQRDRCLGLRNECIKVYTPLSQRFNQDLTELANEVTVEIFKRDSKGQELLYAQLRDIINGFADKFNSACKEKGFSEEVIGTKFSKINVEAADGRLEEKDIRFDFSIADLADDLSIKFNELETEINERFKFLNQKKHLDNEQDGGQTSPIKLPAAPLGIFKPAREEKFYEIEKSLMETNLHLDTTGRWIDTAKSLAEFIWCLKDSGFFASRSKKIIKQERDFFKNRYRFHKQLEQETYPSKKIDISKNQFKLSFS